MTSYPSSNKLNKDEQVAQCNVRKPRWLDGFLRETFFGSCTTHPCRRNVLNQYCINCNMSICHQCELSRPHCRHKRLKIRRHCHKVVVSRSSMEKHIDCSQIQTYRCQKRLVISLNPLLHYDSESNKKKSCNICNRKLIEHDLYHYCSISCKVKAISRKPNNLVPPFNSPYQEKQEETSKSQNLRKKRRKGTPHRAPFF